MKFSYLIMTQQLVLEWNYIKISYNQNINLLKLFYLGQYLNGKKFGKWDTQFKQRNNKDYQSIGKGIMMGME
ncbi:unnamed protein product [Paramecium octaurelia]|uniref:Uncharacterized protein n=1 Tax=Paramecium octaurelia TaxID=43137 RepID=A0A8S1YCU7_PAROT|nr:unnamed protein product [Paramecium octaurelia]